MYVLWIIGAIANLLGISQTSQAMILFVKLPSIICDLAIAYLAYRFAKNKLGKGSGALMSLLVMLLPHAHYRFMRVGADRFRIYASDSCRLYFALSK